MFNHDSPELDTLRSIERRVLWLATRMIHEANLVRPNADGSKVGGHQASSASAVSILVALYFHHLRAGDRVSIKPHASPAFHAVQYLLGNLTRDYLPTLRAFGGLQAYPSRTKDPDVVDFSTGSVGLGAVAPIFAALVDQYRALHSGDNAPRRRFVAVVGDAELDEGNVWEAIADEAIRSARLHNVTLIVDLNRQSLDRIIPGIRVKMLRSFFAAAGWQVLDAKYGQWLEELFQQPGGESLRQRIDDMTNEEYQVLVRLDGEAIRQHMVAGAPLDQQAALAGVLAQLDDSRISALLRDLGGHDLRRLLVTLDEADRDSERPSVIFAYTFKGWGLPIAGDPLNHSALLNAAQIDDLRAELGVPSGDDWAAFDPDSPEAQLCRRAAERLSESTPISSLPAIPPDAIPAHLPLRVPGTSSSQEAFGKTVVELARDKTLVKHLVTLSPDVSISTNLAGWVNQVGVFSSEASPQPPGQIVQPLRWQPAPDGQHIELGISEMNLFMLLGQFGLSYELNGHHLLPIGTVYDPFVCRGLDALIYGLYSGSRFVFAGTPSGISLSPEGGAHQSTVTVSLGIELPNLRMYEPCFAQETAWCLLEGLRLCCDRENGRSTYLRLSTKPVDQSLLDEALRRYGEAELRRQVIAGGYRLIEPPGDLYDAPRVLIVTAGAMIPEAVTAACQLHDEGVAAVVLNLTSADYIFEELQRVRRRALRSATITTSAGTLDAIILPDERGAPIVTVLDGASHALAYLGSAYGQMVVPLGVDRFGQSGTRADLYDREDIDAASIVNAALLSLNFREAQHV